jgi:hypothetical protein
MNFVKVVSVLLRRSIVMELTRNTDWKGFYSFLVSWKGG